MTDRIEIVQPDDWHLHLRDGPHLAAVVAHSAQRFGRAIVMPNLKPPVTTVEAAAAYRARILQALPADSGFQPLMTLYLTESTTPAEIERARACGFVHAVKLYPAGATTHSDAGVRDIARVSDAITAMEACGLPLLVHGEVVDPTVDIFDRERVFLERVLEPLLARHSRLRLVLEHITTAEAAAFVRSAGPRVAATITAHHLLLNRNALFEGGMRPHHYCLPVIKRERHRVALVEAATSGAPCFFLGTDSAPHARDTKEAACGCAGVYTAHAGIELYAEAFDAVDQLDRLEAFASLNGPDFYGLPRNASRVALVRETVQIPQAYPFGPAALVPLRAGGSVAWRLEGAA